VPKQVQSPRVTPLVFEYVFLTDAGKWGIGISCGPSRFEILEVEAVYGEEAGG
jgi:hypothetical protein